MPITIDLPCPNCERVLKVPETVFGKKIKCKHCGEPFEVEQIDLDDDEPKAKKKKPPADKPVPKPSKPGGTTVTTKKEEPKKEEPKKEEPKPAPTPYKFQDDDEEDSAKPSPLGVVYEGEEIPRCPHCAKELDPPDAVVCIHCGFNNVTRTKAESKQVWEPDTNDWINHLGPGIAAAVGAILLIVLNIVCLVSMRDWLTDTFLQKEEKDAQGEIAFYVKPGAFITFILAATIIPIIKFTKFAIKRLAIDNKPTEKVKTT
jgi:hypothetical protein